MISMKVFGLRTRKGVAAAAHALFGKMYEADPLNPAGNPQRYLDLCFLTADHVLRPLLPVRYSKRSRITTAIRAAQSTKISPQYGGNPRPSSSAAGGSQHVSFERWFSQHRRSDKAFTLSAANGVVAKESCNGRWLERGRKLSTRCGVCGDSCRSEQSGADGRPKGGSQCAHARDAGIPAAGAGSIPAKPCARRTVQRGRWLRTFGRPSIRWLIASYDYVSHAGVPADEQYGVERYLDNTWTRLVQTQGFYNYMAAQWTLKNNAGVGLSGDSGAGLFIDGGANVGPVLIGDLTAGKMDKLAAGNVGLKLGYSEIGAPLTQAAAQAFVGACWTFTIQVPEPTTAWLCLAPIATLTLRRRSRCICGRSN